MLFLLPLILFIYQYLHLFWGAALHVINFYTFFLHISLGEQWFYTSSLQSRLWSNFSPHDILYESAVLHIFDHNLKVWLLITGRLGKRLMWWKNPFLFTVVQHCYFWNPRHSQMFDLAIFLLVLSKCIRRVLNNALKQGHIGFRQCPFHILRQKWHYMIVTLT